jgi:hypothetical protein
VIIVSVAGGVFSQTEDAMLDTSRDNLAKIRSTVPALSRST